VPVERGRDACQRVEPIFAPPPSSSHEMTDCVVPMRSASSLWLSPAAVRRS
jgi:hypothetical protein